MYSKNYFRLFTDANKGSVSYQTNDSHIMLEIYQYFDYSKLLNDTNKSIQ